MKLEVSLATLALATIVSLPVAAHTTQYTTDLFGSLENPVNASPGVGVGLVTLDLDTVTMQVQTTFDGLLGNVTASHIHCCVDAPAQRARGHARCRPSRTFRSGGLSALTIAPST